MSKGGGDDIRIVFPIEDDRIRTNAARLSARTRRSVRVLFGNEARYMETFADIAPDRSVAAVAGNDVVGVLLFWDRGRDPCVVSLRQFQRIWGRVRGSWLWLVYSVHQRVQISKGAYSCAVWVDEAARGAGAGRRMYQALIATYEGEIHALARREALKFHQRLGFETYWSPRTAILGWLDDTAAVRMMGQGGHAGEKSEV